MTLVLEGADLRVTARNFPTNKGGLCRKGWTADQLLRIPGRLIAPLMRASKGEALRPVSWDDALDRIAGELRALRARYGDNTVGLFGGGGLKNEKA